MPDASRLRNSGVHVKATHEGSNKILTPVDSVLTIKASPVFVMWPIWNFLTKKGHRSAPLMQSISEFFWQKRDAEASHFISVIQYLSLIIVSSARMSTIAQSNSKESNETSFCSVSAISTIYVTRIILKCTPVVASGRPEAAPRLHLTGRELLISLTRSVDLGD